MNENKKVNSSIVFKLNTWHLSQVFLNLLWINILIILFFTGALLYRAESSIAETAKTLTEQNVMQDWVIETEPKGLKLPEAIERMFPEQMKGAVRQIAKDSFESLFWKRIYATRYRVWIPNQGLFYAIDYDIGKNLSVFLKLFIVLLIFELLSLIGAVRKGARAMRRALLPIAELTETARSINTITQPNIQLRDLTGTIDTINATRLDTRISISSAQKELKDLAGAINGMLDRINEAYRSQVRFVSDASHELRTPIAVIQGYANLLDRWGKNDEKALEESIEAIKSEAESMKDLVEQLLFLARGDNDSMQLNMESINLSELVSEVLRETKMIDQSHEFSSKIGDDVNTIGDLQLIKQAIRIFIDNSIKYTPLGETIFVSTFREGDYSKIMVQDSGIGIPSEDLPHVFDRFYRSDDSRARKTGGTGLGLAIAKWIIDRHGGSVEILSRRDLGTRITVSLLYRIS